MSNNKQDHSGDTNKMVSSVEWQYNELMMINFQYATNRITPGYFQEQLEKIKEQAKEMHRQEIIRAGANHCYPTIGIAIQDAEEYYNEIYKSKENEK